MKKMIALLLGRKIQKRIQYVERLIEELPEGVQRTRLRAAVSLLHDDLGHLGKRAEVHYSDPIFGPLGGGTNKPQTEPARAG